MVLVEDLSAKGREGPPPLPPALQPRGAALRRPRGGCRQKPPPGRSSSIRRAEASKDETGGGEGIPVLQNRPSEQDGERGQFPRQACHLKSKIPGFVQTIAPEGSLVFHEKAWNADPCCRMVVTNEYMKDDFFIKIETWHKPDLGSSENVHKLDPETWENVEVAHIDVADRNQVEPGLRNPGEVRGTSAANEE